MHKPNTAEQVNGLRPAQIVYNFIKEKHICVRCEQRWVEANELFCEVCKAWQIAYRARSERKRKNGKETDPNPTMVEVVIAQEANGNGLLVSLLSDIGNLMTVHHVTSVDVRDVKSGKSKITPYRAA
jgi:hypothetical protein